MSPLAFIFEYSKFLRNNNLSNLLTYCGLNLQNNLRVKNCFAMFALLRTKGLALVVGLLLTASLPTESAELKSTIMNEQMVKTNEARNEKRIAIFANVYKSFFNGIQVSKSTTARKWCDDRKINIITTGACFNSGQIHHRKEQSFKDELESINLLSKSNAPVNNNQIPYSIFGNKSICFPLRNQNNEIVNFYSISIENGKTDFLNSEGIYPYVPKIQTKKLFIVPSILDAATIISLNILENKESVMALYDGVLLTQHEDAIKRLNQLSEVIWIENEKI